MKIALIACIVALPLVFFLGEALGRDVSNWALEEDIGHCEDELEKELKISDDAERIAVHCQQSYSRAIRQLQECRGQGL